MIVQCGETGDRVKFIYSERATKFCEISTNYFTGSTYIGQIIVEILQNFVAFSEYMNFKSEMTLQYPHLLHVAVLQSPL